MEGLVRKGLFLPSLEELQEWHTALPAERMRLPPKLRQDCQTMTDQERERLWVIERNNHIGASDVPIITSTSKFMSSFTLASIKAGVIQPDFETSEHLEMGHEMEDVAARRLLKGLTVVGNDDMKCEVWDPRGIGIVHPTIPYNVVSPDRVLCLGGQKFPNQGPLWMPVEIKNVSEFAKGDWGMASVPDMYYDQVQDQMAAMGAEVLLLLAIIGGNKFVPYTIRRDSARIEYIEQEIRDWWRMVKIEGRMPEVDGSDSTTDTLKQMFLRGNQEVKPLTDEAREKIAEHLKWKERLGQLEAAKKAAEEAKDAAANWLRLFLADAWEAGAKGEPRATWKVQEKLQRDMEAEAEDAELQDAIRVTKTRQDAHKKKVPMRILLTFEK